MYWLLHYLQVTVPLGYHNDCFVSVSFISIHGADKFLLDTVLDMYSALQEQVSAASNSLPLPDTNGNIETSELLKEKVCSILALFQSGYYFIEYIFYKLLSSETHDVRLDAAESSILGFQI